MSELGLGLAEARSTRCRLSATNCDPARQHGSGSRFAESKRVAFYCKS